jgi:hypothetical protein
MGDGAPRRADRTTAAKLGVLSRRSAAVIAVALAVAAAGAIALVGSGEDRGPGADRGPGVDRGPGADRGPGVDRGPGADRTPPAFALDAPAPGPALAVGITEPNPNLVAAPGTRTVPPAFARWRDELAAIHPAVYRLVIDWAAVQPRADMAPDFDATQSGCMRALPPCAPFAGVRDQLEALASRRREGGWEALVVITGAPAWAAVPAGGCDAGDGAPRADTLPAYRALIAGLQAAAAQAGAELRWWSPWNEPNHPAFLAPQRAACDRDAPSLVPASYAAIADALRAELGDDRRLVLGEMAAVLAPTRRATSVQEMIAALPRDLVCAAPVWSQHAYIGGTDPVAAVAAALDARGCPRGQAIWITETGVGAAPSDLSIARGIAGEREGCEALHRRLAEWYGDPRVTLAVQYTLREDDRFPTGLVTTDLTRARPALEEWQAWGAREPAAPPPAATC